MCWKKWTKRESSRLPPDSSFYKIPDHIQYRKILHENGGFFLMHACRKHWKTGPFPACQEYLTPLPPALCKNASICVFALSPTFSKAHTYAFLGISLALLKAHTYAFLMIVPFPQKRMHMRFWGNKQAQIKKPQRPGGRCKIRHSQNRLPAVLLQSLWSTDRMMPFASSCAARSPFCKFARVSSCVFPLYIP